MVDPIADPICTIGPSRPADPPDPIQIADDLKKNGGYVPGIRPGRPTADFLDKTMTRITLIGAMFLTVIAVLPSILSGQFEIPWLVLMLD